MSEDIALEFDKVRQGIDQVDTELVELIARRLKLTGEVGRLKAQLDLPLYVPSREAEIIEKKRELAVKQGVSADLVEDVIRRIMRDSYATQTNTRAKNQQSQSRKIVIVGGAGQLGMMFVNLFTQSGFTVSVIEKEDWGNAEPKLETADLVMVAVPIRITEQVIQKLSHLPKSCTLVDITSIKDEPLQAMLSTHDGPVVGLHPMFGPGIKHLAKQTIVVCHGREQQSYGWLIEQLEVWGAKLCYVDSGQHDHLMAIIQVLRHFSTVAYGYHLKQENIDLDKVLELSSPIYRLELIMVGRLFAQDSELYSDIVFSNKKNIPMIKRFIERMSTLVELLENENIAEFNALFKDVSSWFGDNAGRFLQESNLMLAKANDLRK